MTKIKHGRTPAWMLAVIIICMLPLLLFPYILSNINDTTIPDYLIWLYPAYVITAGICAYITYPQRPEVSWILIALVVLSHLGIIAIM